MKLSSFLFLLFLTLTHAFTTDKPRVWDRIPQYFVDTRVQNFINENRITNCFEYIENSNYLRLKCWKDGKLTDVDITINPGKPKKKHYVNDFLSIII